MKQIIFLVIGAALFAQSVQAEDSCQSFSFSGKVRGEESFRQVIGTEVSFFVEPSGLPGGGFFFLIGPTSSERMEPGYIEWVTPPYRGPDVTGIYPDAEAAQFVAAKGDREFWFLFTRRDAEKAMAALDQVLRPKSDQAFDESLAQLAALPMGKGNFRILDSEIIPGTAKAGEPIGWGLQRDRATLVARSGVVKGIVFKVELVVPPDYAIPKHLRAHPAKCPEPWGKQWSTIREKPKKE